MSIIATLALSCSLALPGEGYTSTACSVLDSQPLIGEWRVDPLDMVQVDTLCVVNEHYWSGGRIVYNHYDGAPPCSTPTFPAPPPFVPQPPPVEPTPVPEPAAGWLVALSAAIAWRGRRA